MVMHAAFLRGINVGGHNTVAMADLRAMFGELGFTAARTLLQSGNVVFEAGRRGASALERWLEVESNKRLGLRADYLVRPADACAAIIDGNPIVEEARREPGRLAVVLLKARPRPAAVTALQIAVVSPEIVRADGSHLYVVYPHGMGRSKLTNTVIERALGTRATARNWNTMLKVAALVQS